jgi:hypothetical protein
VVRGERRRRQPVDGAVRRRGSRRDSPHPAEDVPGHQHRDRPGGGAVSRRRARGGRGRRLHSHRGGDPRHRGRGARHLQRGRGGLRRHGRAARRLPRRSRPGRDQERRRRDQHLPGRDREAGHQPLLDAAQRDAARRVGRCERARPARLGRAHPRRDRRPSRRDPGRALRGPGLRGLDRGARVRAPAPWPHLRPGRRGRPALVARPAGRLAAHRRRRDPAAGEGPGLSRRGVRTAGPRHAS